VKPNFGCPVLGTVNAISGKWKVLVVWHLGFAPKGFAQLRDLLPGISEKVLTTQLRQLEADGIVSRTVTPIAPPQVTYALTAAGEALLEPMTALCHWGVRWLGIPPNLPRYPTPPSTRLQGARRAIR